jgi:hypothetical protein
VRDVKAIDADLNCERAILQYERRGGDACRAATETTARIDQLLDERTAVVLEVQRAASSAVDGRLV